MTKGGKKIIEGLEEALEYARLQNQRVSDHQPGAAEKETAVVPNPSPPRMEGEADLPTLKSDRVGAISGSVEGAAPQDSERLAWLEDWAKRSPTGVSFDWAPTVDGEPSGFRFMRHHYIGKPHSSIRAAIDAELAKATQPSPRKTER